jgi:hypothetical protein
MMDDPQAQVIGSGLGGSDAEARSRPFKVQELFRRGTG